MKRVKDKKVKEAEGKDKQRHNPDLTEKELGDIGDKLHADRPVKETEGEKMQSRDIEERAPSYRPLPATAPRSGSNPWPAFGVGVAAGVLLVAVVVVGSGGLLAPVAAAAVVVVAGTAVTRKRPVPGG